MVQLAGLTFLNGSTLDYVLIIVIRIIGVVFVGMGSHGDDGTGTAENVIVFNGNDATFLFVFVIQASASGISLFASTTARLWAPHKNHLHLKALFRVE